MGSSGGKGGGGSSAPAPTAEYSQYLQQWNAQNTSVLASNNNRSKFMPGGGGQTSPLQTGARGRNADPNAETIAAIQDSRSLSQSQKTDYINKLNNGEITADQLKNGPLEKGEYTGTAKLGESDYYVYKQNKQQKDLEDKMTQQQTEFQNKLTGMQQEQNTLLTNQKAELEAAQKAAYQKSQQSTRDSLFSERQQAESAAVDYVNQQIANEKSNADLFGMKYNLTDADKASRISDYFGSIWNEGNETKLTALMTEVGKPTGFTDFTLKRGNATTTNQGSSAAQSKVVGSTSGLASDSKNRPAKLTSLLTPDDKNASSLLGG